MKAPKVQMPQKPISADRPLAMSKAGAVAARAESLKEPPTISLSYLFSPLAIESLGAIGPKSWNFLTSRI